MSVRARLLALLEGTDHERVAHEAAASTAALAGLRGLPAELGCKALVVKAGSAWVVVAVRVGWEIENRALRHGLGVSRLRFATPDELWEGVGLRPGEVPPFGEPVLPFALVGHRSVSERDRIAFTAGTRTESIVMATADWERLARPRMGIG